MFRKSLVLVALFFGLVACSNQDQGQNQPNIAVPAAPAGQVEGKADTVKFNEVKALAEQGNAEAQHKLGNMYRYGRGVSQDYAEALKWYRKAADQGYYLAQYDLGMMYYDGRGVRQNFLQAYMWLDLAAAGGGDAESARMRDVAAQHMTSAQIEEAQRLASDWKPISDWKPKGHAELENPHDSKLAGPGVPADWANAKTWTLWLTQEESWPHLTLPTHWSALGSFDTESACYNYGEKLIIQLGQLSPRKGYTRGTAALAMHDTRRGRAHDDIQHQVETNVYCTPDDSIPGPPWKHLATSGEDKTARISAKEVYELSQECTKLAAELWDKTAVVRSAVASDPGGSKLKSSYTNHYNSKLNKCMAVMTADTIPKDKSGTMHNKSLFDLHENSEMATFLSDGKQVVLCKVQDKSCSSESEWDALVKPYMEE